MPPVRGTPRQLVAAACAAVGEDAVVEWCCRLIIGREKVDDPHLGWLGGSEEWLPYWRRVWGARGLLYAWTDGDGPEKAVAAALVDDHWRVREMGCKVVRARSLLDLGPTVLDLLSDENTRVRAAAGRAVKALDL
jgi:hypothetical protein